MTDSHDATSTPVPPGPQSRLTLPRRVLGWLGYSWLILGITLFLFLTLELGYRAEQAVFARPKSNKGESAAVRSLHPYADKPWFADFQRDLSKRAHHFDPYRGWAATPITTKYLNVDSQGRRVTIQPAFDTATAARVFMLGGSTMWGFTARDSFTIPSQTAAALKARHIENVEVVNLAQRGYNTTQEATTLLVELARGNRPKVAVFLDGFNDILTALENGEPGHAYSEKAIQEQIDLGGRGFWGELFGLGRHSALISRLHDALATHRTGVPPQGSESGICGKTAVYYRNVAQERAALGREYGFPTLTLLQPIAAASNKPLSPWEKKIHRRESVRICASAIDSAMQDRTGDDYYSLMTLFDTVSATVFIDNFAHVTETANAAIAAVIADRVAPLLERKRSLDHR